MNKVNAAVVSDSHDNAKNLEKVTTVANHKKCTYLFHLGDIISPFTAQKLMGFKGIVKAVFGNCDGELLGLQRVFNTMGGDIDKPPVTLELENKKIILMHEPFLIDEVILSRDADFIFYGHMHKAEVRKVGKTLVLNPGEAGGRGRKPTFFIVDLLSGEHEKINI